MKKCSLQKKIESLQKKNEGLDANLSKNEKYALLYLLLKSDGSNTMQSTLEDALNGDGIEYRDLVNKELVNIQDGSYAAASPEYAGDDDTVYVLCWDGEGERDAAPHQVRDSLYGLIVDNKINLE